MNKNTNKSEKNQKMKMRRMIMPKQTFVKILD